MHAKRTVPLSLAVLALTAPASAAPEPPSSARILVRLSPDLAADDAEQALRGHGLRRASAGPDHAGWIALRADDAQGSTAEIALLGRLRADRRFAAAEPNFQAHSTAIVSSTVRTWTPSDPWLSRQWNLAELPSAWYVTRGSEAVRVAVLDTGLRTGSEAPLHILPGHDFVNDDADPADDNGHGTHMSSIIAQSTDNALLAAGMAPGVSLLPVKVLDAAGRGTVATVAEGIYFATDAGAHVINLSLSLNPAVVWSTPLHDAIAYAAARGVVLVGASGNDGAASVSLPAAFNEVIAVGSLNSGGAVSPYSNRGAALDLLAPGGDEVDRDLDGHPDGILAWAFDGGGEGLFLGAGTSQAAAHVAGAAALLMSLGEGDRDRIRTLLELSAAPLGSGTGWSPEQGYGRLRPAAAIAARARVATVAERHLSGFIPGQHGSGGDPLDLAQASGVVVRHPSGLLVLLRDRSGLHALAEASDGRVAVYRLRNRSWVPLLRAPGGLQARLDAAGSVLGWLEASGSVLAYIEAAGGLAGMIGSAGARLGPGESLVLIDAGRGAGGILDGQGGITAFIEGSGSVLAWLESQGGLVGMLESSGGTLALLDATGSFLGLVESASAGGGWASGSGLVAVTD